MSGFESDYDVATGHFKPFQIQYMQARRPVVIDQDTTDAFLNGPDLRYAPEGKTLEEKVEELAIETNPMRLPPRGGPRS